MTILALDTTSEFGSVAVQVNGETAAEVTLHSAEGFSHLIFAAVKDVLHMAGVRLERIDRFAAATGPGSFTGVRVGLSAIKGLAETIGKPAVGVSNLQALASFGHLPLRAVTLDARRGQVYAAVYDCNLQVVAPETVLAFEDWLATLDAPDYEFISPASLPLKGTRFAAMPFIEPPKALASAIAACAALADAQNPLTLDANYVRRSDAELFWRDN